MADPAIWDASRGESIYETALKHRLFFEKGDNRADTGVDAAALPDEL